MTGDQQVSNPKTVYEIDYWSNIEESLRDVQNQLHTPEVEFQLLVLNDVKRCLYYEKGTGIVHKLEDVSIVNTLMRDFPIEPLFGATTLEEVRMALQGIFSQLRKLKTATAYPLPRAITFIAGISRDTAQQMIKIMNQQRLFECSRSEFDNIAHDCRKIFEVRCLCVCGKLLFSYGTTNGVKSRI